jgi:hypothetical protein
MASFDRTIWRVKPPPGTPLEEVPYAPDILCCPLNEYGGLQVWDYSTSRNYGGNAGNISTASGTTFTRQDRRDGRYLSFQSTDCRMSWNAAGSGTGQLLNGMPTAAVTVLVGRIKRDSTARASTLFGMETTSSTQFRLGSHCPYSDGTVYWDWENTSTGRLSVASLTFADDVFAFTAGARGQEIWQNGQLKASNANTAARTAGGTTFNIGYGNGLTSPASDLVDYNFIYVWSKQLPQSLIQELSRMPFSIFKRYQRTAVFGFSIQSFVYAPSGGLQTGGAATTTTSGTHPYLPSGGLQLGGAAAHSKGKAYLPSGGLQTGGAATCFAILNVVEKFQDLAETTVGVAGYTAGSGVLNVLSTASPFKSTGLYSVAISDPTSTNVKALLTVTAVNSGTQFAVISGGLDANCAAGDIVTAVETERSIDQLRKDVSRFGAFSVMPGIAKQGDVYRADDGYEFVYDGTNWVPYNLTVKMRKPVLADYAAINLAGGSLNDSSNGLFLQDSTAEEGLHIYKLAAPSTPYTITARMSGMMELQSSKSPGFGLCFRASGSAKVETIMASNNSGVGANPGCWVGVDYWTDSTTFSSALASAICFTCSLDDLWFKISDDGTNKLFYVSSDGVNWIQLLSETRTTNLTANEVGWFIRTNNAAQVVAALLRSWQAS